METAAIVCSSGNSGSDGTADAMISRTGTKSLTEPDRKRKQDREGNEKCKNVKGKRRIFYA
jgi:hypothetical protein